MAQRSINPNWLPNEAWVEKGYTFYDRLEVAARKLGPMVR